MRYKTVNLDVKIHKRLKRKALEKDSSIIGELTEILSKELKEENQNE